MEGEGWEPAWKENEVLAKWVRQTANNAGYARTSTGTQQGLLTIYIHMQAEVATGQWPSILAAEAQGRTHLWECYGPPSLWKFSGDIYNLHRCTLTARTSSKARNKIYPAAQLVGIGIF